MTSDEQMNEGAGGGWDDDRVLCPDGNCIGVIGPDGRCPVCGTAAPEGTVLPTRSASVEASGGSEGADDYDAVMALADAGSTGEEAWEEDRRLCPDGSCIGLLDATGTCKVCGRRA